MGETQVVLGFDMETDIGSWTPFYEGMRHGTGPLLKVLERQEVTATFFFTAHCAEQFPEVVRHIRSLGHEIGAHTLFHETIGEPLYELPGLPPVLPEEIPLRLKLCTEKIERVAGERPVSFRCPRLFGSTAVVRALDELGYVADASYPMYFFRERLTPYHPGAEDWTQEGDLSIVELPNFADLSMISTDPYGRDRDQWPLFRTESAEVLLQHIDGYSSYCASRDVDPFLCFYFHPWEFHPMPEGEMHLSEAWVRLDSFIVKNCGEYALQQLELLIAALKQRGGVFLQARQAAARCVANQVL